MRFSNLSLDKSAFKGFITRKYTCECAIKAIIDPSIYANDIQETFKTEQEMYIRLAELEKELGLVKTVSQNSTECLKTQELIYTLSRLESLKDISAIKNSKSKLLVMGKSGGYSIKGVVSVNYENVRNVTVKVYSSVDNSYLGRVYCDDNGRFEINLYNDDCVHLKFSKKYCKSVHKENVKPKVWYDNKAKEFHVNLDFIENNSERIYTRGVLREAVVEKNVDCPVITGQVFLKGKPLSDDEREGIKILAYDCNTDELVDKTTLDSDSCYTLKCPNKNNAYNIVINTQASPLPIKSKVYTGIFPAWSEVFKSSVSLD